MPISRNIRPTICILLFILISVLSSCGGDSGPAEPNGGDNTPAYDNVVSSLISVNPSSGMAGILANQSGAMVFIQETNTTAVVINRVVVITNTGESTVIVRNAKARPLSANATTSERYFTVETAINEVADSVNRAIQDDLESSPLTRVVSGELVRALENEILNPESLTDRVNRFATDTALECVSDAPSCVNSFLEGIGNSEDQVADPDENPGDPPLIYGDDIDIVDDDGVRTPTADLAQFTVSPLQPTTPADLSVSLAEGTPTNFNGTGLTYSWSYEELPSDGFEPTVFGSGFSANLALMEPGSYRIILNVHFSGGGGDVATSSRTVEVLPGAVDGPSFTATTTNTTLPKTYNLVATDPSDSATGFDWSCSNGLTAQGQESSLIFTEAGVFTITLTVTYPDDTTVQVNQTITVTSGGGGGGGEVTPYIQEIFDHHAGTFTSNEVRIHLDGQYYGPGEDATYDGVNPLYDYVFTIDAETLTVSYSSAGGSGAYTFPGDILEYYEVFHSSVYNEDDFRLKFRIGDDLENGILGTVFALSENETAISFHKSYRLNATSPLSSFTIIYNKP